MGPGLDIWVWMSPYPPGRARGPPWAPLGAQNGGGCSGLQYGFAFETKIEDDDYILQKKDVTFIIDNVSFQYLDGASVDYISDLKGSQFVVKNPNAKSTCSCGSSFVA